MSLDKPRWINGGLSCEETPEYFLAGATGPGILRGNPDQGHTSVCVCERVCARETETDRERAREREKERKREREREREREEGVKNISTLLTSIPPLLCCDAD